MCIHDGLDEKCPGASCPCDCMGCVMGSPEQNLLWEAKRYVKKTRAQSLQLDDEFCIRTYLEMVLKEEPEENSEAIELAEAMLRGEA